MSIDNVGVLGVFKAWNLHHHLIVTMHCLNQECRVRRRKRLDSAVFRANIGDCQLYTTPRLESMTLTEHAVMPQVWPRMNSKVNNTCHEVKDLSGRLVSLASHMVAIRLNSLRMLRCHPRGLGHAGCKRPSKQDYQCYELQHEHSSPLKCLLQCRCSSRSRSSEGHESKYRCRSM